VGILIVVAGIAVVDVVARNSYDAGMAHRSGENGREAAVGAQRPAARAFRTW